MEYLIILPYSWSYEVLSISLAPPFKFNTTWLKDPNYTNLVMDYWHSHPCEMGRTITDVITFLKSRDYLLNGKKTNETEMNIISLPLSQV